MTGLLCVAHGSRDLRHAHTVDAIVAAVRSARPGLAVDAAYLDLCPPGVPEVAAALADAGERQLVVLPLLLNAAYHSSVDVPAALDAAASRRPLLELRQAAVLGPHPLLASALWRRLTEARVPPVGPPTGIVLASAGTSDRAARARMRQVARMVHVPGWPPVALAYASAAGPTVSEAVAAFRARGIARVAVASYFLAPGRLPDVVRRQAEDAGVPVTDVLGAAPELVRLALDRYDGTQASLRAAA